MRQSRRFLLVVLALMLGACGSPANSGSGVGAAPTSAEKDTTTTMKKADGEFTCPVTLPTKPGFVAPEPKAAVYTESFPQPESYPTEYPGDESVWYGDDGLWTVLALDGIHDERKTVLWSTNFPGGTVEEQPDLHVTWTRLDTKKERVVDNDGVATNAHTPEHGWFMITGTDVLEPGCWQVDATYEGATLTYVYAKS